MDPLAEWSLALFLDNQPVQLKNGDCTDHALRHSPAPSFDGQGGAQVDALWSLDQTQVQIGGSNLDPVDRLTEEIEDLGDRTSKTQRAFENGHGVLPG